MDRGKAFERREIREILEDEGYEVVEVDVERACEWLLERLDRVVWWFLVFLAGVFFGYFWAFMAFAG